MTKIYNATTKKYQEVDDYHFFDVYGYFPTNDYIITVKGD
jgi:hypothetical protein